MIERIRITEEENRITGEVLMHNRKWWTEVIEITKSGNRPWKVSLSMCLPQDIKNAKMVANCVASVLSMVE